MSRAACDEAPVITVPNRDEPKPITIIYPYYDNPGFFKEQLIRWCHYPEELLSHLNFIVVDDGSREYPAAPVVRSLGLVNNFPIRLFCIEVDIRWNWLAARNIAAHHAAEGWLAITDMDHIMREPLVRNLIYGNHDEGVIYRFSREGEKSHPHPNSWFYTRQMYWRIGGYDEDASGFYGTDGDYRRRAAATAPIRILSDKLLLCEHQGDASTKRYLRKQPEDARGKQILKDKARRGLKPSVLTFPYHEIEL